MSEHNNAMEEAIKTAKSSEKQFEEMTISYKRFEKIFMDGEKFREMTEQFINTSAKDFFDKISSSVNYLPELSFPKRDYSVINIPTPEENNHYQSDEK